MEKSDFLNYRAQVLEVRQLRSLVAELERARYSAPGSEADDKYHDALDMYRAKVSEKTDALIAIESAFESLDSPVERLLMRLRYIEGRSWPSICLELQSLGYSDRHIYRMHGFALLKLKEVCIYEKQKK